MKSSHYSSRLIQGALEFSFPGRNKFVLQNELRLFNKQLLHNFPAHMKANKNVEISSKHEACGHSFIAVHGIATV